MSDNRMVWDRKPGHYEVWYTTVTHEASRTGFWIRYTLHAPLPGHGTAHGQLWFARFDRARPERTLGIHKRVPIEALTAEDEPFRVALGEAEQRDDGCRGAFAGDGHEVSWDLRFPPAARTHRHLPDLFYDRLGGRLGDTKVLAPNLRQPTTGTITVDGERYAFDGDRAGQSHVWGRKHAYQWAWSHCVRFDGRDDAAFESLSARLRRGAVILPRMSVFSLFLDGEELAFRDPWRIPLTRADHQTGRYHLIGVSQTARVEATLTCRPDDMILTEYVDPDGDAAFCHNTCAGDAVIKVQRRSPFVGRWRDHATLVSTGSAHWEWGARAGDAANVKRRHVAV